MAKNKLVRSDNYNSIKSKAGREKSALRRERAKVEEKDPTLRVKRQRENAPVTIEHKRYYDPSRITDSREQVTQTDSSKVKSESDESDDEETAHALKQGDTRMSNDDEDEDEDEETKPDLATERSTKDGKRTLITTSPNPTQISYHFMTILQTVFPLSDTIRRGSNKYTIQEIAKYANKRGYQNLIILNEDRKQVNALTFITLPMGPTAYFTLTSVQLKQLATHTTHAPELLLTNFTTSLGHSLTSIFKGLFLPVAPQVNGRQTITLHNSRDFIFFRRHRYLFTGAGDKVRLQEIGPRFTMKCREVVHGVGRNGEVVWRSDAGLESDRKRMFL